MLALPGLPATRGLDPANTPGVMKIGGAGVPAEVSGVKKLLMAKPVQKSMDAEVAGLARAKALLEA